MKYKEKEINKLLFRKKLWSIMGWFWKKKNHETTDDFNDNSGIGYLRNNHSLNCGCSQCRNNTYYRRKENKKNRLKTRKELKEKLKEDIL